MAKPTVRKVGSSLALKDLYHARKVASGDRVCFLLPLRKSKQKKRRWKFVRGTLWLSYYTYCPCCGAFFKAEIEKADGTKVLLCDDYRGTGGCLPYC